MLHMTYVLDCPDPRELAGFYAALLDTEFKDEADDWVTLVGIPGATIAFQQAPEYRPPTWPAPDVQQMAHLDFEVPDRSAAHAKAISLGAKLLDDTHTSFAVYADPAGHPFCLCAN
jgi:catechol 2,3-dioxygenase-like lactoylglutathione lyase family enzyme